MLNEDYSVDTIFRDDFDLQQIKQGENLLIKEPIISMVDLNTKSQCLTLFQKIITEKLYESLTFLSLDNLHSKIVYCNNFFLPLRKYRGLQPKLYFPF